MNCSKGKPRMHWRTAKKTGQEVGGGSRNKDAGADVPDAGGGTDYDCGSGIFYDTDLRGENK